MAQYYAASHLAIIDERFSLESKTGPISNHGINLDFNGKNSVTIYNINTVIENNYTRSGTNRFGSAVELGTGEQTFTLSQDKAFTYTIDRGNLNDSLMAQAVDESIKRQVREVSIPTVDKYRLSVLIAYAQGAGQQPSDATLSSSTAFTAVLTERAALQNANVPLEDMVLYIHPTIEQYLWLDTNFKAACDTRNADVKTGKIGTLMGMDIITVPQSYFPTAKINFMLVSKKLLVAPTKFNSIRTLSEVPGIDGWLVEGRRYYDAFIPTQKATAIRVHEQA